MGYVPLDLWPSLFNPDGSPKDEATYKAEYDAWCRKAERRILRNHIAAMGLVAFAMIFVVVIAAVVHWK